MKKNVAGQGMDKDREGQGPWVRFYAGTRTSHYWSIKRLRLTV